MSRQALGNARSSKKDEFYTLYEDVKFELDHYIDQLKGKTIYCPCDTEESAFVKYFLELERDGTIKELLYSSLSTGMDFLSDGAIDGYRHSDIVVTNPPFSLFRPFLSLLDSLNKQFIIWGTTNCVSYIPFVKMLVKNRIRPGYIFNKTCSFEVPHDYGNKAYIRGDKTLVDVPACTVFTNLNVNRTNHIEFSKVFDSTYVKYSNFDAINVNKTSDIPVDYNGLIGVPITYLGVHDPSKFDIVGIFNNYKECDLDSGLITGDLVQLDKPPWKTRGPCINGNQPTYIRIILKRPS